MGLLQVYQEYTEGNDLADYSRDTASDRDSCSRWSCLCSSTLLLYKFLN